MTVSILLLVLLIGGVIYVSLPYRYSDYNESILLWTRIGAIGSWIGALFGALALVISILAFVIPSMTKINATLMFGFVGGSNSQTFDVLTVIVKNLGMKPVTINNVYLRFKGFPGTIFISTMGNGTPIQHIQTSFPKRLDVGDSFSFLIPEEKLINFLKAQDQIKSTAKVIIVVDEVTEGYKKFETTITKSDIVKSVR